MATAQAELSPQTLQPRRPQWPAGTATSKTARRFLREVEQSDPQELMARATGNYKRGNERMGKNRPRSR